MQEGLSKIFTFLFSKEKITAYVISGLLAAAAAGYGVNNEEVKKQICDVKVETK